MGFARTGYWAAAVVVLSAGLLGAGAFLFDLPPFESEVGVIKVSSICDSLGRSGRSTDALKSVLPERSSYSFKEDAGDLRLDDQDSSYRSDCFVSGEGQMLMSAVVEMMPAEPAEDWTEEVVAQYAKGHLTSFPAGDKGVASPTVAAVLLPCVSPGKIAGGQYNLSILVHLKRSGGADGTRAREDLIALAEGAAAYAHSKAKCDMSPRVAG